MSKTTIKIGDTVNIGGVPAKVTEVATDGICYVMDNGNTGFMPNNYFE